VNTQATQPEPNQQPTLPKKRKWLCRIGIGFLVILASVIVFFPQRTDLYAGLCLGVKSYARESIPDKKIGEMPPLYKGVMLFGLKIYEIVETREYGRLYEQIPSYCFGITVS
jgi:hypothetical protein